MGKIISVCNQKGGVGKTTTCVNLAAGLGILEKKVLVIDTDPQANATQTFGFPSKKLNNNALEQMRVLSVLKNNLIKTNSPNVDLIPYFEDVNIFKQTSKTSRFKKALDEITDLYDFIIIDCTPFLNSKNLEILISSNSVIIPVQCDYYALEGLHSFLKTIRYTQKNLNPNLSVEGFLLTMFDNRVNLSKKIVGYMQTNFKDLVLKTIINRNIKIAQAPSESKTIFQYNINSIGAKDYLQLANEMIENNTNQKPATEAPIIPKEEESIFNLKVLSKATKNQSHNSSPLNKSSSDFTENKLLRTSNFKELIGQDKYHIKKKYGLQNNILEDNIWVFKLEKVSGLFKKKYLNLIFENNKVVQYKLKRFKPS